MEQLLEDAYEKYIEKKERSTNQRKRLKQKHVEDGLEDDDDEGDVHPDEDSDNDQQIQESNPLMIPFDDTEPTEEEIAAKWFSQDVFDDDNKQENTKMDESEDDEEDEMQIDNKKPKKELVVAKKCVQVRTGKGKVLVDRRMKSDARKQGMTKDKARAKGKGKGKGKNEWWERAES